MSDNSLYELQESIQNTVSSPCLKGTTNDCSTTVLNCEGCFKEFRSKAEYIVICDDCRLKACGQSFKNCCYAFLSLLISQVMMKKIQLAKYKMLFYRSKFSSLMILKSMIAAKPKRIPLQQIFLVRVIFMECIQLVTSKFTNLQRCLTKTILTTKMKFLSLAGMFMITSVLYNQAKMWQKCISIHAVIL